MALRLKRGAQYGYGSAIRARLNPEFGDLPITEVTADRVEEWWVRLRGEGMTMRHVASIRSVLKGICRRAVSLGLIQSTPVEGTEARWLFPSRRRPMNRLTPETMGNMMRKIFRAAGLRKIRPHDLRHTYATLAIEAGVDLLTVSRQLRHSSIAITADIYAHAMPGGNRAAADVMEGILTGNQTQPRRNPAR